MKRIAYFLFIFSLAYTISLPAIAQKKAKTVRVSAKIEVLMEGTYSKDAIKQKAIEAARIQALGEEFGYAIVQGINTQTKNESGSVVMTNSKLTEVSNTIVKGEWLEDDKGFPKTKFVIRDTDKDQQIWLLCEVSGKARAITEAPVDFQSFTYKCDEPEKCPTSQFKHGESMFVYFKSPVKGYLSVYMQEDGKVYRLLPYRQMQGQYESHVPIEADKPYQLFSPKYTQYFADFPIVDEYGLELHQDGTPLSNMVFVVFSTKPFAKPILKADENGILFAEQKAFQTWLNQQKGLDKSFQFSRLPVAVNE
jgi:hypothetical protein